MKISFIFTEFDKERPVSLNHLRYETPNYDNIKQYFPEADIKLYTEKDVDNPFEKHPRWGMRMHDYWKVKKMLEDDADIIIGLDADLLIVNTMVRGIIPLTQRFGFCVAASSRGLIKRDARIGVDSDKQVDETLGTGFTMCPALLTINKNDERARKALETTCSLMLENPLRLPLVLWRGIYKTGYYPYILPQNWCVCEDDLGIGNEIILHIGHKKVKDFYNETIVKICS